MQPCLSDTFVCADTPGPDALVDRDGSLLEALSCLQEVAVLWGYDLFVIEREGEKRRRVLPWMPALNEVDLRQACSLISDGDRIWVCSHDRDSQGWLLPQWVTDLLWVQADQDRVDVFEKASRWEQLHGQRGEAGQGRQKALALTRNYQCMVRAGLPRDRARAVIDEVLHGRTLQRKLDLPFAVF